VIGNEPEFLRADRLDHVLKVLPPAFLVGLGLRRHLETIENVVPRIATMTCTPPFDNFEAK
jgi:hypothetical protein